MSCPCQRKGMVIEDESDKKDKWFTNPEEKIYSKDDIKFKCEFLHENSRLVIFDIDEMDKFFKIPKNFLMKTANDESVQALKHYNSVYAANYMGDSNFLIALLHFQEKEQYTPKDKSLTRYKDAYRVDDLLLVSYDSKKSIELIEINLKNNLKKDSVLTGFISNFKDTNRHHKIIYKKSSILSKQIVYDIVVMNKELSEDNIRKLLEKK